MVTLHPYQEKIIKSLIEMDLSQIEHRLLGGTMSLRMKKPKRPRIGYLLPTTGGDDV